MESGTITILKYLVYRRVVGGSELLAAFGSEEDAVDYLYGMLNKHPGYVHDGMFITRRRVVEIIEDI